MFYRCVKQNHSKPALSVKRNNKWVQSWNILGNSDLWSICPAMLNIWTGFNSFRRWVIHIYQLDWIQRTWMEHFIFWKHIRTMRSEWSLHNQFYKILWICGPKFRVQNCRCLKFLVCSKISESSLARLNKIYYHI